MTPERHSKLQKIFEGAIDLSEPQRSAYLDQACADDPSLRDRLNQLLIADEEPVIVAEPISASARSAVMECPKCWQCYDNSLSACPRDGTTLQLAFAGPQLIDGKYLVERRLGSGGMGAVYLARDTRLRRDVAIKVSQVRFNPRFEREARAIAALSHPNICTLFDVGPDYLVMEYIEGTPLPGPLPLEKAVEYALQILDALDAAHQKGIIHRDLKPGNILVTQRGVKLLDFGLAKLRHGHHQAVPSEGETESFSLTYAGVVMGTPAYMAPEQWEGKPADPRSDIYAFGCVLYEMVTGKRAAEQREPVKPAELQDIIQQCLAKDPADRWQTVGDLRTRLEYCRALPSEPVSGINLPVLLRKSKRPRVAIPLVLILLALGSLSAWWLQRSSRVRWAKDQAMPQIAQLVGQDKLGEAYVLAVKAERYIPDSPMLAKFWPEISWSASIKTKPPGASVFRRNYNAHGNAWEFVGHSPIEKRRMPLVDSQWKFELKGFATVERATFGDDSLNVTMDEEGKGPTGMVRVEFPTQSTPVTLWGISGLEDLPLIPLEDFWIDRYEVTNAQFKKFLDEGGYEKQEYWKEEFRKDGHALSWAEAMALFRDRTGRPGPATWVLGEYPRGQEDFPVTGVSWFEATAYAKFTGKLLPTIYHWKAAASPLASATIVPASNFGRQGPAHVGSYSGMSVAGAYDMAGNVKEWSWNEAGSGKRYILGGAWDEATYMFNDADARSPFERSTNFGFRCAKYVIAGETTKAADPVTRQPRDFNRERPVSDQLFQVYKSFYSYDKTPLHARVESTQQTGDWNEEKITFDAAYGNERIIAYLFLPRKARPPFQTVVYFPGAGAVYSPSFADEMELDLYDFVIKSGRAVIVPVYKGTFERRDKPEYWPNTTSSYRDHVIAWSKDLGRSIDYLETRPDIDSSKLAYEGYSWGAAMGSLFPALEDRIRACVLICPGFYLQKGSPEVDGLNFAPRVKVPVLMLNGRFDFIWPPEISQEPMFRLLGTPKEHKRRVVYETGHNIPTNEMIKETLDWLDRYLGPVK